jgi:uncharacterized protein (DUF305 family)
MKKLWLLLGIPVLIITGVIGMTVFADGPIEGRPGRAELRFLEGMIDHHQMALDMANDCLAKASTESVKTLCQNIIDAQSTEITTMQDWVFDWYNVNYNPMSMTDMMAMMDEGMEDMDHSTMEGMEGMPATDPAMMMGMMAGLNRLEGVEYEVAFLESMIDHHDDAIHMSERILERAPEGESHPELRELAQQIIDDQTAEIEAMETQLTELGS